MKKKIFNKMKDYGWSLEDFDEVYDYHYDFIDKLYERNKDNDTVDFDYISHGVVWDTICFMSDFLRAINDLESELNEHESV